MQGHLIRIGNSQGVRLPKAVIEQAGLTEELDIEVAKGAVVIRPVKRSRQGWAEAAAECHAAGEDRLDDWEATISDFEGPWS